MKYDVHRSLIRVEKRGSFLSTPEVNNEVEMVCKSTDTSETCISKIMNEECKRLRCHCNKENTLF